MNIALDYDSTYTERPEIFNALIKLFQDYGDKVFIVTMRYQDSKIEEIPESLSSRVNGVIYTNRRAKVNFVEEMGITIDIWIDDSPHWLFYNFK